MAHALTALKAECVRLRVEERLSLRTIRERTGASQGSLSGWLKPFPLNDDEKKALVTAARERDRAEGRFWGHTPKVRAVASPIHDAASYGMLNRSGKGFLAEVAVMFRLSRIGVVDIYRPTGDGARCDMMVMRPDGSICKMQVKTAKYHSKGKGLANVSLMRHCGARSFTRYLPHEFDVIVGYEPVSDKAYVFSQEETSHLRTSVTVRDDALERWDKLLAM